MRHADRGRLEAIWKALETNPGIRPAGVARELGLHRSAVTRPLPALEEQGLLLSTTTAVSQKRSPKQSL
jgi:Mn-dependent DtxR family transcriptional regulator